MSCKGNIGVSGNDPKQWVAESDEANLPLYHSVGLPGPLRRRPGQTQWPGTQPYPPGRGAQWPGSQRVAPTVLST